MEKEVKAKILQDAIIVAGHPRSGTSLACQLVESAGVEFPSDFDGDEYNRAGYYEIEKSKKLSKKLIKEAMTIKNTIKMNKIVSRLNDCTEIAGLKLVRIPAIFFYKHVAKNLQTVFVYRNPVDVKASLLRRGISKFEPDWFKNNNALIAARENIENSIVISYESLLAGKEYVQEAFQSLGLKINLNLIKQGERTQQHSRVVVSKKEELLYERLQEMEKESCKGGKK